VLWWRRLSIAAKLPLGIGTLLLLALGTMAGAAYVEVRQGAVDLASERLERVSMQFAMGVGREPQQRVATLSAVSDREAVRRYLTTESPSLREAALDTLRARASRTDSHVELRHRDGRRLLTSDSVSVLATADAREESHALDGGVSVPREGVGPFEREGDRLSYTIAVAVRDSGGLHGYLVERFPISNSPEEAQALAEMIGSGARLLVGSVDSGAWTDLAGAVDGPPNDVRGRDGIFQYERAGKRVFARAHLVPATPWMMVMEFARDSVLAPADRFLRQAALFSILLATLGAGVAWWLSRRMSVPLQQVTDAAEAMAQGREVEPVAVAREDEVGRLAQSFNAMASQVAESRTALEQRVIERTAALEAANRELESFSYSVSHDLRAPLRAVDGFAAVLVEDHTEELSVDAQRCVGLIRNSAQQMGQLIDDLLTFSRLGRQPLTLSPVEMDGFVHGVVAEACDRYGRDISDFVIEPLPPALANRSMLKQVVANYVENALKFTAGRERPAIRISARVEQDETVYTFQDNGVGFDMRYVDKLFGVFQRLHAVEEFQGTGVGLAIVKRVIERHGGRVWAEAVPDVGATFHFTLPAAD